jgi:hypothetical protein
MMWLPPLTFRECVYLLACMAWFKVRRAWGGR